MRAKDEMTPPYVIRIRMFTPPLGQTEHCRRCGRELSPQEEEDQLCDECGDMCDAGEC